MIYIHTTTLVPPEYFVSLLNQYSLPLREVSVYGSNPDGKFRCIRVHNDEATIARFISEEVAMEYARSGGNFTNSLTSFIRFLKDREARKKPKINMCYIPEDDL